MERVAFIVESTGERLNALLNPEHVEVQRVAGVRRRSLAGGRLTGDGLSDDRLIYTGGGLTRLELQLLFDVTLATSTEEERPASVRELTGPFWNLAENQGEREGYGRPPLVRFVWGKSWNVLGVVSAVAERLEYFDTFGAPRRSWLALRLTRVPDQRAATEAGRPADLAELPSTFASAPAEEIVYHEVMGVGDVQGKPRRGEQIDAIAFRYYEDPAYWRFLALYNGLDDPTRLEPGTVLEVPPRRIFEAIR